MKQLSFLAITILCAQSVHAACKIENIWGGADKHDRQFAQTIGDGWTLDAKVCSVGSYDVAVPSHPQGDHDSRIVVLRHGKLLMWKKLGETLVYDTESRHANTGHPVVNILKGQKGKKKITELWYQTQPNREGRYVMSDDMNFDGLADARTVWKGDKAKQVFIWYKDEWHQVKKHKIRIGGAWKPFKHAAFKNGRWHVQSK